MLFEEPRCGGAWRMRTILIGLVYFSYAVAVLVSMGVAINDQAAETAALAIVITAACLHFCTSLYALYVQPGGRVSVQSEVGSAVQVADWLQGVALGLAAGAVRRPGSELATVITSAVLVCLAQLVCFAKTVLFLDSSRYEQDSGDKL